MQIYCIYQDLGGFAASEARYYHLLQYWFSEAQSCVSSKQTETILQVVFMDNNTYEETRLRRDESWAKWLKEGDTVPLISWNGLVITVDVPKSVSLTIAETEPGIQGNRSSSGTKSAVLETGAKIQVGLFFFFPTCMYGTQYEHCSCQIFKNL